MSYTCTFITIAPDSKAQKGEIPVSSRAKKPIHVIQYELLTQNPYKFGHEELIFEVYLEKEGLKDISDNEKKEIWDKLFEKGHPCLRASTLTKKYGFGAHYNQQGKIAIYSMNSKDYQGFISDDKVEKLPAMRTKRK